jgi:hypothetical protein
VKLAPSFRRQAFLEYVAAQRWYEKQRPGLGREFETEIQRALFRACAAQSGFLARKNEIRLEETSISSL